MAVTRLTSRDIQDGTITNDDVAAGAGLEPGKLAVPSGQIIVGNMDGQGQAVNVSGDASLGSDGSLSIASFGEGQRGLAPGPDSTAIGGGYVLRADGNWVPHDNTLPVENETPQPVFETSDQFSLAQSPAGSSLRLFKNGIRQTQGSGFDYTLSGNVITFEPDNVPQVGDVLVADYRYSS